MSKTMLIDAAHPEETRVVVMNGSKVEAFDFESRAKKQLRGNIYLAKVTRVEPSLQAAFVEYGGNRHGFLAFNEIHPDYYQIPLADREALMREAEEEDADHGPGPAHAADEEFDSLGGDDDDEIDEEVARRRRRLMRRYKIQEVIKRRQIMLIQVVKEERGNKGAALTTYLSLAGRYCVLMPNTDRGGGISRKITAVTDRKRLRSIVQDLDVPEGMGLIVRTAGAKRTKAEIKRDYEYLSRAWSNIRDTTLHSIAPALIYEEEDLVKRAIRDLYDKDIDGVWVEGEAGFRDARAFMRMLMPAQAKKVQPYRGPAPLFMAYKVEDHLAQIYSPTVPLKSGGYLVINQTEALVAVDVNSGRATKERNIEATALKTNLEAAEEAARQLRLRDLAGLIVIDFIDMDESKNNRAVEKVLKDCLAQDRARIQMGRISSFGLMEISRQRRRTGILEGTTHVCPHCAGAGRVRSVESSSLAALRAMEMEALKGGGEVIVRVPRDVSLYILNHKRDYLTRIHQSHGLFVSVVIDEALAQADHQIDRITTVPHEVDRSWEGPSPSLYADLDDDLDIEEEEEEEEDEENVAEDGGVESSEDEDDDEEEDAPRGAERPARAVTPSAAQDEDAGRRKGRRRRRGRRGDEPRVTPALPDRPAAAVAAPAVDQDGEGGQSRRRRGRRGGRRQREDARPNDVYAWSWPARLSGDDPYEWRGPAERPAPQVAAESTEEVDRLPAAMAVVEVEGSAAALPPLPIGLTSTVEADDMWVELPEAAEPASRPSRGRSRGRGRRQTPSEAAPFATPEPRALEETAAAQAEPSLEAPAAPSEAAAPDEAPAAAADLPDIEAAPVATAPLEAERVQPAPADLELAAAAPPPPRDPAEIVAPPAAPRRGWWRRGS